MIFVFYILGILVAGVPSWLVIRSLKKQLAWFTEVGPNSIAIARCKPPTLELQLFQKFYEHYDSLTIIEPREEKRVIDLSSSRS